MRVLIIGCGYVGLPLGIELMQRGHEVFGLRRNDTGELAASGIRPLLGDISDAGSLKSLPNRFDWVVNTVAVGGGGAAEYRRVYLEGNRNVVSWLAEHPPRRFVYTSSTSVYGQDDGSEVNEKSATEPGAETSQVLLETEEFLHKQAEERNLSAVVLRCAGIYGPGRGYWLQQFLRGEAVMEGRGDRWLNMIHRDDVVGAIVTVLEQSPDREEGLTSEQSPDRQGGSSAKYDRNLRGAFAVYNVVDDEPVQQRTVFEWLAARLKQPMPRSVSAEPGARRRGATNKRVSNHKLRLELGWKLQYPSFRQGYEAEIARLRAG